MQKIISIVLSCLSLFVIADTGCGHSTENKAMAGLKKLPRFTLLSIDSIHFVRSEDIAIGRLSVFFYFDPSCEHCQKETKGIVTHQKELKEVQIYFVSSAATEQIDSFYRYYQLDRLSNVFVGTDYQFSFFNAFLPSTIPYLAIYDKSKHLTKVYNGETDIQSLISQTRN